MSLFALSLYGFLALAALNFIIIIHCKICDIHAKNRLSIGLKDHGNQAVWYYKPGEIVRIQVRYNISEMNPDAVKLHWYSERRTEQNGPIWIAEKDGGITTSYGDLPGGSGSDIGLLHQRFILTFPMPVYDDVYFCRLTYWCGARQSEALRSPHHMVMLKLKDVPSPVLSFQFKAGLSPTGYPALQKDDVIELTCYSQAPHHYIDGIEFTIYEGDKVLNTRSLPSCERGDEPYKNKCPRDWLAAKGRPSFQSSYEGASNPSAAVDGDRNTCMRTERENNPWWGVELEFDTYVENVRITNTANGGSHLRIGVTQTSPEDNAPSTQNIYVCSEKNSPLLGTETFSCEAFGKYLVIINEAAYSDFNLCEVEIKSRKHPKSITYVTVKPEHHNMLWYCKSMWPLWTPDDYKDHLSISLSYEVVWLPTKLEISHNVAVDGAKPGFRASITCEHNNAYPPLDITWSHFGFDGTPKKRNNKIINLGKYNIQSGSRLGGQDHGQVTTSILSFTVELSDSEHKYFCYIAGPQQSALLQNFTSFHVKEASTIPTATRPTMPTTTAGGEQQEPKKGEPKPNPLPTILGIVFGIVGLVCTVVILVVLWRSFKKENATSKDKVVKALTRILADSKR